MKFSLAFLLVLGLTTTINSSPLKKSSRSLHDDFDDFKALLPNDEILKIFYTYLENDEEIQAAFEFMTSPEFVELVKTVENMDDVINFYDYLQESGLDIYDLLSKLHEILDLPPFVPQTFPSRRIARGMNGMIQDIKAILPIEDIKELYHKKLETSEDFKKLIDRLQSGKLQEIINAMYGDETFVEIIKRFKEAGIDVQAVADLFFTILGVKFPTLEPSSLGQNLLYVEFDDFLELIPVEKLEEILEQYITSDNEVQDAISFSGTSQFRELVIQTEAIPAVGEFLEYLDESGVDVYDAMKELHLYVGLPEYKPFTRSNRLTGGIVGLGEDIIANIPVNDIKSLYEKKVIESPAFAFLHERLTSPKFLELLRNIIEHDDFYKVVQKVEEAGIDVGGLFELLDSFIAEIFPEPTAIRSLESDFDDFVDLVPMTEIANIAFEYVAADTEVQNAVQYITSEEFKELLMKLQGEEDLYEVLEYISDAGLDVFSIIDLVNDFLGVPPYSRPETLIARIGGGVQGMLDEIRAILPYVGFKKLYEEKMESSKEFKSFVEKFHGPEFQKMIDVLVENENFVELGCQAAVHGINLQRISDLLQEILGLKLPPIPDCTEKFNPYLRSKTFYKR